MQFIELNWRSYANLPSDAEAAAISGFCRFSLATLEIACSPVTNSVALVEQEHPDAWRWLVVNPDGFVTDSGTEPSRECAQSAVIRAFRLEATRVEMDWACSSSR